MSFCALYVVSASLVPPGGGATAAKSRAVQDGRLRPATPQRPYIGRTSARDGI